MDMPMMNKNPKLINPGEIFEFECAQIEAQFWIVYGLNHLNPALREMASFIAIHCDFQEEYSIDESRKDFQPELTSLQVLEAETWLNYFRNHSLEVL